MVLVRFCCIILENTFWYTSCIRSHQVVRLFKTFTPAGVYKTRIAQGSVTKTWRFFLEVSHRGLLSTSDSNHSIQYDRLFFSHISQVVPYDTLRNHRWWENVNRREKKKKEHKNPHKHRGWSHPWFFSSFQWTNAISWRKQATTHKAWWRALKLVRHTAESHVSAFSFCWRKICGAEWRLIMTPPKKKKKKRRRV